MKKTYVSGFTSLLTLLTLVACGNEASVERPYAPGDITLIGQALGGTEVHLSQCGKRCATVEKTCGEGAAADVILDESGAALDVICFKPNLDVQHVGEAPVSRVEVGNNTVLVFDEVSDGFDVEKDVVVKGNNVVVWGKNPDVASIGGTLKIEKNNAVVRGVRIRGDVAITKNNAQLSFCVIEGNLTITGNNTTLAECEVHGNITIAGVNTVLVANRFAQPGPIEGKNLSCNNNYLLGDHDGDASVPADAVTCAESNAHLAPQSDVELGETGDVEEDAG